MDGKENGVNNRMKASLMGGAVLGVVCVIGAYVRSGFTASPGFVFSLWYNRVIIGLTVGAPWRSSSRGIRLFRGAILGLTVSFAFYSATGFDDMVSFLAGIAYGMILEVWLEQREKKSR